MNDSEAETEKEFIMNTNTGKKSITARFIAVILCFLLVITLTPNTGRAAEDPSQGEPAPEEISSEDMKLTQKDVDRSDVIESENTEDSTTYSLGGGKKMTVVYGQDVRYEDENGDLVDIDPSLKTTGSRAETENGVSLYGYSYENKEGESRQYMPDSLSEDTPVLLERDGLGISMSPDDDTLDILGISESTIDVKDAKTQTPYEDDKMLPTRAVYDKNGSSGKIEYISTDTGVKEKTVLKDKPSSNVLRYVLDTEGLYVRKNSSDEGLTFYDEKTDEIAASMPVPNMNDDSGRAYSEEITTDIEKKNGKYIVTLTIDEEYLEDSDRQYPVTVDPTLTWSGSSKLQDVYVINGSQYSNTNFYDSGITKMAAGKGTQGIFRTYLRNPNLRANFVGRYVSSAKLTIYERGNGASGKTIKAYRVTENWNLSSIKWNNQPSHGTDPNGTAKTTGTTGKALNISILAYARYMAKDNPGYGLLLKNSSESSSGSYADFYGSRYSTSSKRPKYTIVHYPAPSRATMTASPIYIKRGAATKISWKGINSVALARIEYKITKYNSSTGEFDTVLGYSSSRSLGSKSSGSVTANRFKDYSPGKYHFHVRGVDKAGMTGSGQYKGIVIDGTNPTLSSASITPASSSSNPASDKTPVIHWSGASDTYFKEVQASIDGASYKRIGTAGSGTYTVPASAFKSQKAHTIKVRARDKAGNFSTVKTLNYYLDATAPAFGTLTLKDSDQQTIGSNWSSETDPVICFSNITEADSGITISGIKYAISSGTSRPSESAFKSATGRTVTEGNDNKYSGSFHILSEDRSKASGTWYIHVRIADTLGNAAYSRIIYKKDVKNPTGAIRIKHLDLEVSEAKDTVQIEGAVSDTHSGVQTSSMKLYRVEEIEGDEEETFVQDIYTNQTENKITSFDTTSHANGSYRLKLTITDNVGNEGVVTKDFTIANPIPAPQLSTSATSTRQAQISWAFAAALHARVQYKLENGAWTDIPSSSGLTGNFTVTLPDTDGTYTVKVRGVDSQGVEGREAETECITDTVDPAAGITDFEGGILSGTAEDTNFSKWEIYIKKREDPDTSYAKVLEGTNAVHEDEFGYIDLSEYDQNCYYTLKLKAEDAAGNISNITYAIYIPQGYAGCTVVQPAFTISRPCSEPASENTFVIPTQTESLMLTASGNNTLSSASVEWYVDGACVSNDTIYEEDFSGQPVGNGDPVFDIGESYDICAKITDAAGNITYSRPLVQGRAEAEADFTNVQGTNNTWQTTVSLPYDAVSFRLNAPSQISGDDITYEVKALTDTFTEADPGDTIYVTDISGGALKAGSITLKVTMPTGSDISDISIRITEDTIRGEKFKISEAENYRPTGLTAVDKINYRTYVRWDLPQGLPDDISYEVYRGETAGFTPSMKNRIAEGLKEGYYAEMNTNYSGTFYYKVRAVSDTLSADKSRFSTEVSSRVVDADEYAKRLGSKECWSYAEASMPNGDISIEKSKGNLLFSQTDIEIDNDDMPLEISRVYNSQASAVSAFGPGWSHNYDLELLAVCHGSTSQMEQIAYRDETGSIILFSKGSDGKYISNLGKYMILEEDEQTEDFTIPARGNISGETRTVESAYTLTTKDGDSYRFDASGTLVLYQDNNENTLFFDYDPEKGLLTKVTAGRNISLNISYCDGTGGTNPLCISEISMPDGGSITYEYDNDGMLGSAVRHASSGNDTITYSFDYSNTANSYPSLSEMTDANGNDYGVSYTGKKADEITYPDNSALRLTYQTGSTVTDIVAGGYTIDTQTDYFNDEGNCVRSIDKNELETTYSYADDMLVETSSQVEYEELEGGQVVVKDDYVTDTSDYDEDKYLTEEVDESGNTIDYEYYSTTGSGACEGQISSETEESGDGVITSDIDYEYDENGNETLSEDSVTGEKTVTEYYGENEEGGEPGQLKSAVEYYENESGSICIEKGSTNYSYSYNNNGCLTETEVEESDENEITTTTVYDAMGRTMSEASDNGDYVETITYSYDGFGRQTGTTHTVGNETKTTQTTYDPNGNVLTQTDEDGTTITNIYDNMNRSLSTTTSKDGLSTTTTSVYSNENINVRGDLIHAQVVQTNTDGVISKTYSDGENVVKEESDGMATVYDLDASGNVIAEYTVGTSGGERLDSVYVTDINGEQTSEIENPDSIDGNYVISEDSVVSYTTYDSQGNITAETDENENETSYSYDAQSRETRVELPDGTGRDIEYFVLGDGSEQETVTDERGHESYTISSPAGNETKISDVGDGIVDPIEKTYTYDADGNVTRQDGAEGNYKTFEYNAKGENTVTEYYDKNDVNTFKTEYTYDDSGNVIITKDSKKEGDSMVLFRYATFSYDGLGRIISEAEIYGSSEPSDSEIAERTITYQYDSQGRVATIGYPPVLSSVYSVTGLRYVYDNYGRLSQIKAVMGNDEEILREYFYDQYGILTERRDHRDFASGEADYISCEYGYDNLGRVTSMEYSDSTDSVVFESYALEYDKAGNITREAITNSLPTNEEDQVNEIRDHEYDSLGRLTATEITAQPDGEPVRTEYTYDSVGNRLSMIEGDNITEYTYNSLDQLTAKTVTEDGVTVSESESEYDKNGNLISQETEIDNDGTTETETKEYTYDPDNMMTGCTVTQENTVSVDQICVYNGDGQRTYKADSDDNTRYYYMSGSVLYTESDVAIQPEEGDGDGDGPGNDSDEEDPIETKITSFNVLSPEGSVIASAREIAGSDEYFIYNNDMRGSTTNIVSDAGACVANYTYTDFGETSAGENVDLYNEICYTGGIYDEETGEYYLNARYYDPAGGRFTTQDTHREDASEGTANHLYCYCDNNPSTKIDPSGHVPYVFWNKSWHYFAFKQNAPQKRFGYYDIYDWAAGYLGMKLHRFKVVAAKWKLQLWKGLYGKAYGYKVSSGCEIGLYYKKKLWHCAHDSRKRTNKRLRMRMSLYRKGHKKKLFTRDSKNTTKKGKAWWLTAFKPANYMPNKKAVGPKKLRMTGTIWFNTNKYGGKMKLLKQAFIKEAKKPKNKMRITRKTKSYLSFSWRR